MTVLHCTVFAHKKRENMICDRGAVYITGKGRRDNSGQEMSIQVKSEPVFLQDTRRPGRQASHMLNQTTGNDGWTGGVVRRPFP